MKIIFKTIFYMEFLLIANRFDQRQPETRGSRLYISLVKALENELSVEREILSTVFENQFGGGGLDHDLSVIDVMDKSILNKVIDQNVGKGLIYHCLE